MIIDGLQINDWSRDVIEEVRSGGVDVVHATVGVWEDMAGAMTPDRSISPPVSAQCRPHPDHPVG